MKRIKKKHPLAVRWFHWINFPVLGVMIWSGLLIYWANDVYRLGWGDKTILKFFPDSFYKALSVPFHLADGMAFHFVFMWFFAINGLLYILYTAFSGEWKYLLPDKKSFKEAGQVLLHDLHISKYKPPQSRYNGAQKIAYTLIILMGFGSLLTGLAIYKPIQFGWITFLLGGYEWARIEHFALTIGYVLFFVIHIAQVIKAGWQNFSAMVTGFEVERVIKEVKIVEMRIAGDTEKKVNVAIAIEAETIEVRHPHDREESIDGEKIVVVLQTNDAEKIVEAEIVKEDEKQVKVDNIIEVVKSIEVEKAEETTEDDKKIDALKIKSQPPSDETESNQQQS